MEQAPRCMRCGGSRDIGSHVFCEKPKPATMLRGLVIAGAVLAGLLFVLIGNAAEELGDSAEVASFSGDVELLGIGGEVPDAPFGSFAAETEAPIPVAETGTRNPMDGMDGDNPQETGGFYFGTEGEPECDRDQFLFGLSTNSDLLSAVADGAGVNQSRMALWVNNLTPGFVPGDTRITRFGWDGSALTPTQAVLQSGTAVLVAPNGAPVVMCNGGSLLGGPDDWDNPNFTGVEWDDFDSGDLLTIQVGDEEAIFMVCIDPETGERFIRLVGVITPPPTFESGGKSLEITLTWEGADDDLDLHVTEPSGTTLNFTNQTDVSPDGGSLTPDIIPAGDTGLHTERIFYPNAPPGSFDIDVRNYDTGSSDDEQVCFNLVAKVNGVDVPGSPQSGCPASDNGNGGPDGFGKSLASINLTCDETGGRLTTVETPTTTSTTAPPSTTTTAPGRIPDVNGPGDGTSQEPQNPPAQPPTPTTIQCEDGLAVNEVTSCDFARNVRDAYFEQGRPRQVTAFSPATGREITMQCTATDETAVCTGGDNAKVYIG